MDSRDLQRPAGVYRFSEDRLDGWPLGRTNWQRHRGPAQYEQAATTEIRSNKMILWTWRFSGGGCTETSDAERPRRSEQHS